MKLLYIGAESANWVITLCNEMCKLGHEVTCVVQQKDEYDAGTIVKYHKNLTRINVEWDDFFNPLRIKSKLVRELTTNKYDWVFGSHAPISPVVADIARTYRLPWGIMLLDIPKDLMEQDRNRMLQWIQWFDILKYANVMVFNTYVARDLYYEYTKQWFDDTHVITYGTSFNEEYFMSGVGKDDNYILSICRLTNMKAVSSITKALGELKNPPKQVIIGRDRGDLNEIKYFAAENGVDIEHHENVTEKEKYELIKNCTCLIYPQESEYIGGLSPWEGLYVGKPVICKDYKVLRELYKGANIIYATPFNTEKLTQAIAIVRELKTFDFLVKKDAELAKREASFEYMAKQLVGLMK